MQRCDVDDYTATDCERDSGQSTCEYKRKAVEACICMKLTWFQIPITTKIICFLLQINLEV